MNFSRLKRRIAREPNTNPKPQHRSFAEYYSARYGTGVHVAAKPTEIQWAEMIDKTKRRKALNALLVLLRDNNNDPGFKSRRELRTFLQENGGVKSLEYLETSFRKLAQKHDWPFRLPGSRIVVFPFEYEGVEKATSQNQSNEATRRF